MITSPEKLPPVVREILAVFEHDLTDVRFGDLDAGRLFALAERVRIAEEGVEGARAQLEQARETHGAMLADLVVLSEKALAYARIYAESEPELASRLEALVEAPPEKKKRRRRKAKTDPEVTELPFEQLAS